MPVNRGVGVGGGVADQGDGGTGCPRLLLAIDGRGRSEVKLSSTAKRLDSATKYPSKSPRARIRL